MSNSFLDESIGYHVNMAGMLLKRELAGVFKAQGFDVTPEQWAVLSRLAEKDGLSQNDIALITFKDNANITRIVDKLQKKGLLERRAHPSDRRTWLLYITLPGKEIIERLQPLAIKVLEKPPGKYPERKSENSIIKCKRSSTTCGSFF